MLIPLIRTLILYFFIIAAMRLMGKRQVGEMQPAELVITILISAVASVPMQDIELPLIHGIIPILVLVSAEIIMSSLSLRFPFLRTLISGKPIVLIRHGVIDQSAMKKLRVTIDDLLEDLRLKSVYDIRNVCLAQMETNGKLSILLESQNEPPTAKDMKVQTPKARDFGIVISDGKLVKNGLKNCGKNEKWLSKTLSSYKVESVNQVFLLLSDREDGVVLFKKEDSK